MQVTRPGGQLWEQCKWRHLMTKFWPNASCAIWWCQLMVKFRTEPGGATCSFRDYSSHGLNFRVRCASGNVLLDLSYSNATDHKSQCNWKHVNTDNEGCHHSKHICLNYVMLFSSFPLFKSFHVANYGQLCQGDIPPSLIVLFLLNILMVNSVILFSWWHLKMNRDIEVRNMLWFETYPRK